MSWVKPIEVHHSSSERKRGALSAIDIPRAHDPGNGLSEIVFLETMESRQSNGNEARPYIAGPSAGLQQRSCAGKAAGLQGLGSDGRRRRASRAALFNCRLETSS